MKEQLERQQYYDKLLTQIVFFLNIVILMSNIAAAILSHSLSIVSAGIDSGVDCIGALVMWFVNI
jgi:divalent metal cation (Fe/Co/Zn/Cd) transporter